MVSITTRGKDLLTPARSKGHTHTNTSNCQEIIFPSSCCVGIHDAFIFFSLTRGARIDYDPIGLVLLLAKHFLKASLAYPG